MINIIARIERAKRNPNKNEEHPNIGQRCGIAN